MPGEVEQAAPCCQIKECGLEVLNWQVKHNAHARAAVFRRRAVIESACIDNVIENARLVAIASFHLLKAAFGQVLVSFKLYRGGAMIAQLIR